MIDKLEIIYKTIDIYRSIIITDDNQETLERLIKDLEDKYHSPLLIRNKEEINYNYRLFIITNINLLPIFDKNSYNLIIIYS